ncbi:hypothetical protein Tco_0741566 [Tanacetum coccineum]
MQKMFRAKKMTYERVVGNYTQHNAQLRDYYIELKERNPNTTVKIEVERPKVIDIDPNNGIYPLAYDVVEYENKDSWKWFLDCLGDDLELLRNSNFTFISDRQKKVQDKCDGPLTPNAAKAFKLIEKAVVKKWELSGIPCTHAVASIWDMASNGIDTRIPESYCNPCYWLATWKKMYKFKINPVNGPHALEELDVPTTIIPTKTSPTDWQTTKEKEKECS